jgi:hypothetical protein
LYNYETKFAGKGLSEPEIIVINKVDIYEDRENNLASTIAEAGLKLKNSLLKPKKPVFVNEISNENRKQQLNNELSLLNKSKLVTSKELVDKPLKISLLPSLNLFSKSRSPKKDPELPKFANAQIEENENELFDPNQVEVTHDNPNDIEANHENPNDLEINHENPNDLEINHENTDDNFIINNIVNEIVNENETLSELDILKKSGLVKERTKNLEK